MVKSTTLMMAVLATVVGSAFGGYSDNCHGSSRCNKGMGPACRSAYARFTDGTVYNAYVSRTFGHCTAIYRCNSGYPALTGAQLKGFFAPIFAGQGCQGCGSHAFDGGNCEVTVNYCSNCVDSGNPN
ncbi:hypothetical protein EMPS_07818 [Entomortierella parvispora]|uniref:Uncharacterized protein n=1 Tax=Entomortierella parvispora TaxID=205924 RepID=A0A9P3LZ17_9FUNG|nr:hypothetical protein EMPS_07818 [Entomortierella parvispora]